MDILIINNIFLNFMFSLATLIIWYIILVYTHIPATTSGVSRIFLEGDGVKINFNSK